ncbi:hypothetical protein I3843_01G241900 [Carya illinoinensis]|uniref:VQ domain-containing protein n=1 Tax=Carya illinoinensis TaxID=32201 RepID=A0A8T1RQR2_CARIL|nr:VQ motif-containing protein 11-like [Carya illinoinensis]KAG2729368.1 hypothetical protein I3760_01G246900 [Carya illinoinensis]KAG6669517.1 hypothetical protein CIPAW_01G250000 [Carya illinoinensis]KAG6734004.1 hypothetical protein I3842_01G251600 [Carya illinoinensis]KAG7998095.1 hypothetical protein I3843_01G241900 [Carya illinoinensis]
MASNTSNCNAIMRLPTYASDPTSPNTTFVQADPSNFRAVVQKLTGAPEDPSALKLPLTLKPAHHHTTPKPTNSTAAAATEMGPRKPTFKLHERRHATKKLELNIEHAAAFNKHCMAKPSFNSGPSSAPSASSSGSHVRTMIFSPVSPLELYGRGSPRTPRELEEEEERAIAEKGFYLHPSPLSTPRGSDPPELLTLFPLHSPRDLLNHNSYSH